MAHRDLPVRSLAPKSPDFLPKLRDLFFHVQPHPDVRRGKSDSRARFVANRSTTRYGAANIVDRVRARSSPADVFQMFRITLLKPPDSWYPPVWRRAPSVWRS